MEQRLIDANALIAKLNEKKIVGRLNTVRLIEEAPTIEARQTVRHVILNHPRFGKCDACYDEARQLFYFDCITKELLDKYGWTFEEGADDVVQGNSNI